MIYTAERKISARQWRDEELSLTDKLVSVIDHPQHTKIIAYRQELRDWPSTESFPDTRPTLGS
mgnify:CR=1 FL=1